MIPELGKSPGEGNGNPIQYSCQENHLDRGAWWVTVHGVAKSRTRLSNFTNSRGIPKDASLFCLLLLNIYLSIWLCRLLVVAHGIFIVAGRLLSGCVLHATSLPCVTWELSSLTRVRTHCFGRILNHWTTRKVHFSFVF